MFWEEIADVMKLLYRSELADEMQIVYCTTIFDLHAGK